MLTKTPIVMVAERIYLFKPTYVCDLVDKGKCSLTAVTIFFKLVYNVIIHASVTIPIQQLF